MHHAAKHAPRAKHVVIVVLQKGIRVIKFTVVLATLKQNAANVATQKKVTHVATLAFH